MDQFNKIVSESLKSKRPNLSDKSLKSYVSTLINLPKKMEDKPDNINYFEKNVDKIIKFLKDKPSRSRKSVLSPLVVITDNKKYKELMRSDIENYDTSVKKQEKTPTEEKNWMDFENIKLKHDKLKILFNSGLKTKNLEKDDKLFESMNLFVLLSCFVLMPPRRALDFAVLKYKNFSKEKDNFIDMKKKTITYNIYKTAKKYGTQTFDIPNELLLVFKKWIIIKSKFDDDDYVVNTSNNSSNDITKLLNGVFKPKKVSVNMLRHSYLTHFYKNQTGIPSLVIMEKLASQMSHSVEMQLQYLRKD